MSVDVGWGAKGGTESVHSFVTYSLCTTSLKKVWKITTNAWMLWSSGCKQLMGNVDAFEGWTKMFTVIKHFKTKKHEHYKMCKAVSQE